MSDLTCRIVLWSANDEARTKRMFAWAQIRFCNTFRSIFFSPACIITPSRIIMTDCKTVCTKRSMLQAFMKELPWVEEKRLENQVFDMKKLISIKNKGIIKCDKQYINFFIIFQNENEDKNRIKSRNDLFFVDFVLPLTHHPHLGPAALQSRQFFKLLQVCDKINLMQQTMTKVWTKIIFDILLIKQKMTCILK